MPVSVLSSLSPSSALAAPFASAQGVLYYDPQVTNTMNTGGTGTSSSSPWYNGTGRATWTNTDTELYFGGNGQVAPYTFTTALSNMVISGASDATRTLNLYFQGNYTYTKSASQTNTSNIGSPSTNTYAYLGLTIDAAKTVEFVAGTDVGGLNRISLQSYGNNSITPAILLSGNGSVTLGHQVDLVQGQTNGHIRIGASGAAPAVTALAGSTFTGSRLQLAAGTLALGAQGDLVSLDVTGLPDTFLYDLIATGTTLQLSVAAIPEPEAAAALTGLSALALLYRRRRQVAR